MVKQTKSKKVAKKTAVKPGAARPTLLAGGNPRIAKADGDAAVQAYIASQGRLCWRAPASVRSTTSTCIPTIRPALLPMTAADAPRCTSAFFRGASLRPIPPGDSKSSDTRYIDIREGDELDEVQMADWVKQAAELPGFFGPRS